MNRADLALAELRPETAAALRAADVTIGIPTYNRSQLLKRAIESVLAQTYSNFVVLVSDNASTDDTAEVVGALDDPRVIYSPTSENIGRTANFNRIIESTETEFLVILGDDDELLPEHLAMTLPAMKRHPNVGVGHTGYAIVDQHGATLAPHEGGTRGDVEVMTGLEFAEMSMRKGPHVCISSTVWRRDAIRGAGGLWEQDGIIDDFPLLFRIAKNWDFAYVDAPLAVLRAHSGASSSELGWFTSRGFRSAREMPDILYAHRLRFLADADLDATRRRRLARIAERSHRRDVLSHLSMRAVTGDSQREVFGALKAEIEADPRLAADPLTWRFIAGQLGGRRVRNALRRALARARRSP